MEGKSAISMTRLSKTYLSGFRRRAVPALRTIDLDVPSGAAFGFVGPNGAGKTTTMKILMGFSPPDAGEAQLFGVDVRHWQARKPVGFLPERPYFPPNLSGLELMLMVAGLRDIPSDAATKQAMELLERVDLIGSEHRRLHSYSKGMLQRLGMAQVLLGDPSLVILDEPMSGLDPMGRALIRSVIRQLRQDGKTVFFSSHILSDVEDLCTEIALLDRGSIVFSGPLEELLARHQNGIDIFARNLERTSLDGFPPFADAGGGIQRLRCDNDEQARQAQKAILELGGSIQEVRVARPNLEEVVVRELGTAGGGE